MCLSVPGKVIKIRGDTAILDYGSEKREAKLISNDVKVGDFALVQGGIVIQKIDKEEAIESLSAYNRMLGES